MTDDELKLLRALRKLERDEEPVSFTTIREAAGMSDRAMLAAWEKLYLGGHVELRPALTNAGLKAAGKRAA